jgi:mannose-1-phosphate guanylyltransferase
MFTISVQRLAPLFPAERIFVVTGPDYLEALRTDAPEIPPENFIVEPYGKDNGPAAGLALTIIHERDPEATIAILTADHHIARQEKFRDILVVAYEISQDNHIVTLGISPTFPATGFGYIQQGEVLRQINGYTCYHSLGFTEKPGLVRATRFVASGEYSWNSGMFIWKATQALKEFERQQPAMYAGFLELRPSIGTPDYEKRLAEIWDPMPKISIDFAIMEQAENMAVISVDIGWSDVGSWASLFEVLELDRFGNCTRGQGPESVMLDTHNTLVYSDRLAVTIGINDIIVVDTDDVLLICHKEQAQAVKDIVSDLRRNDHSKYL